MDRALRASSVVEDDDDEEEDEMEDSSSSASALSTLFFLLRDALRLLEVVSVGIFFAAAVGVGCFFLFLYGPRFFLC